MERLTKVVRQQKTITIIVLLTAAIMLSATLTEITTQSIFAHEQARVKMLRLGYFPNVNHAKVVIGLGKGDF